MFQLEFLAHFRARGRAYAHVFEEVFGFQIACIEKKLWPFEYTPFFLLFSAHTWGGALWNDRLKTWLDCTDLAEFLIFFTKKGPSNIAASRVKIGRTYASLQPIEATMDWNLNRL